MERESLLSILIMLLGGIALQLFAWWPSAGAADAAPVELERASWRRLWYPVVPALFLAASAGMIVNALITDPRNTGVTFLIILAGIPAYLAWKATRRGGAGAQ